MGVGYVYVIELWRQRGPCGEFSGGVAEVDCRTIAVGDTLIRAHRLTILKVEWHFEEHGLLGILSNDGALRLYHLSNPHAPQLTLCVSAPHPTHSQTLCLDKEGTVVSFSFLPRDVLLMQDCLELQTVSLKEGEQPTPPLPMYPIDKHNYSDMAQDILVIPSHPPVVVMATESGRLLHCVYMTSEDSDDENEVCTCTCREGLVSLTMAIYVCFACLQIVDQDGLISVIESISLAFEEPTSLKLINGKGIWEGSSSAREQISSLIGLVVGGV